jgi:hypothetical protein
MSPQLVCFHTTGAGAAMEDKNFSDQITFAHNLTLISMHKRAQVEKPVKKLAFPKEY